MYLTNTNFNCRFIAGYDQSRNILGCTRVKPTTGALCLFAFVSDHWIIVNKIHSILTFH